MNRQKLLLAILLLLLVIAVISAYLRWPRQQSVGVVKTVTRAGMVAPVSRSAGTVKPETDDRFVHLDLLLQENRQASSVRRNIFLPILNGGQSQLIALKPPPPPPKVPIVAPPPVQQPPPVQRDMPRFTLLGFLRKDGMQTVFLSKDNKIVLAKKGDRIEGKYEVSGMTDETLTIRVLSDGSEVVIPLHENNPLKPSH